MYDWIITAISLMLELFIELICGIYESVDSVYKLVLIRIHIFLGNRSSSYIYISKFNILHYNPNIEISTTPDTSICPNPNTRSSISHITYGLTDATITT